MKNDERIILLGKKEETTVVKKESYENRSISGLYKNVSDKILV